MNVFEDQKVFMVACGQTVDVQNDEQYELYKTLIDEEVKEFFESDNKANTIKEMMDMIVVICGGLHSMGINPESAWKEVVRSNMSKVDKETGKVIRRADGKILKPETYSPPDYKQFV